MYTQVIMYRYTSQDDKIIYMQVALLKSLDQLPGPDLHAGPMPVGTDAIPAATAALGPRPLPRHNKVFPAIAQAVASLLLLDIAVSSIFDALMSSSSRTASGFRRATVCGTPSMMPSISARLMRQM